MLVHSGVSFPELVQKFSQFCFERTGEVPHQSVVSGDLKHTMMHNFYGKGKVVSPQCVVGKQTIVNFRALFK